MSDANLSYSCKKTELVKLFFVLLYFCSGMRQPLFLLAVISVQRCLYCSFYEKYY